MQAIQQGSVHHLAIKVPSYRLWAAYKAVPAFHRARRLGLRDSFQCWRLALWDEQRGRLVPFRDLRQSPAEIIEAVRDTLSNGKL